MIWLIRYKSEVGLMGPTSENQRITSSKVTSTAEPCSLSRCRILETDQSGILPRLLTITTLNQRTVQPSGVFASYPFYSGWWWSSLLLLYSSFILLLFFLNLDIPLALTLESTFPKPKGVNGSLWIYGAAGESSMCILYLLSPKDDGQ